MTDCTGSIAFGSSTEKCTCVNAGVQQSHLAVVSTSVDCSDSAICEAKNNCVMYAAVSGWSWDVNGGI